MGERFIMRHRGLAVAVAAAVLAAPLAFGLWRHRAGERALALADAVHRFESGLLGPFVEEGEGAPSPGALAEAFGIFRGEWGGGGAVTALGLGTADALASRGADGEALSVLERVRGEARGSLQRYLLGVRLAVLLEDAGRFLEAAEALEELVRTSSLVLEGKVHMDLGRLYLAAGEPDRARPHFRHAIDRGDDPDVDRMARLYLEDME